MCACASGGWGGYTPVRDESGGKDVKCNEKDHRRKGKWVRTVRAGVNHGGEKRASSDDKPRGRHVGL